MNNITLYLIIGITFGVLLGYRKLKASKQEFHNSIKPLNNPSKKPFPSLWRSILRDRVKFYNRLTRDEKDRKSTRLNSSHVRISYAVFCLKKKKKKKNKINTKKTKHT